MSLEVWSTVASIGTFVVIAATAIAALVQLRHMRSGNQIAVYAHLEEQYDSDVVRASFRFIIKELPVRMKDPTFRRALSGPSIGEEARPILPLMNVYGDMGTMVKHGYIDKDFVLENYGGQILGAWDALAGVVPIIRRAQGPGVWLNFEYLASLAKQMMDEGRYDLYPRGVPRMALDTTWLDADNA